MTSTASMIGLAIGITVGLIICIFVFRYMNKDKKMATKYDEMQEIVRGRAYKYSFWVLLILIAILACLEVGGIELPMEKLVLYFILIFISVLVQTGYCIWNDAYIGINTNVRRFVIVAVVISIINLFSAFAAFKTGNMMVDGKLQTPFVNFLCAVLFLIIGIEVFIKYASDKRASED